VEVKRPYSNGEQGAEARGKEQEEVGMTTKSDTGKFPESWSWYELQHECYICGSTREGEENFTT
jgi:hypothetical protein